VKVKEEEDLDAQCVVCCFVPWKYPGVPTWATETRVLVKIISSDQPVFEQQWYETSTIVFIFYSYPSTNETYNCFKSEVVKMCTQWELENSEMEGRRVSMLPMIVIIMIITFFSRTEKVKERDGN
jgi:hypothetical protein